MKNMWDLFLFIHESVTLECELGEFKYFSCHVLQKVMLYQQNSIVINRGYVYPTL